MATLDDKVNSYTFDTSVFSDNGYNYLAIGNSITTHDVASYWWNEGVGMAASDADHDYFHIVSKKINSELGLSIKSNRTEAKNTTILNSFDVNFSAWELQGNDRAETLSTLDGFLTPNLDLISIQLGENATDISSFKEDTEELIRYIKSSAPNAKIVIIGEFWTDKDKDNAKKKACQDCDAIFVDLSSMWNDKTYQAGMGSIVLDNQGNQHKINREGVGKHPGDKGMQKIAELVWDAIIE